MKSGLKLIGIIAGIVSVVAMVVLACIYIEDIMEYLKKIKNKLNAKVQ